MTDLQHHYPYTSTGMWVVFLVVGKAHVSITGACCLARVAARRKVAGFVYPTAWCSLTLYGRGALVHGAHTRTIHTICHKTYLGTLALAAVCFIGVAAIGTTRVVCLHTLCSTMSDFGALLNTGPSHPPHTHIGWVLGNTLSLHTTSPSPQ